MIALWSTSLCKKDDLCYISTPISLILIRTVVAFDPNMSGRGIAHCLRAYLKILEPTALYALWQYGLLRFQARDTKLERFLAKNQHTQRKGSNLENWCSGELSKIGHHFRK